MPISTLSYRGETTNGSASEAAPLALFDSGIGGLTVLDAIFRRRPDLSFYYIADQAHVPYGDRPLREIRAFARALTHHAFQSVQAERVIMACNISSATFGRLAQTQYGQDRVFSMIEWGASAARSATRNRRIGVLATQGTVQTEAYPAALGAEVTCIQVACPKFVPLIEANLATSTAANEAVKEALEPIIRHEVDTLVLGCTHYPFLDAIIRKQAPSLTIIDPAEALAKHLAEATPNACVSPAPHRLLTTGPLSTFKQQLNHLYPHLLNRSEVTQIEWIPDTRPGRILLSQSDTANGHQ